MTNKHKRVSYIVKRLKVYLGGLTKGVLKMDIKKIKKLFDQALIVVLLTVSAIQFISWFTQYELVVVGLTVLATLRLVR